MPEKNDRMMTKKNKNGMGKTLRIYFLFSTGLGFFA